MEDLGEFITNSIAPLKSQSDIDYPLMKYGILKTFNNNRCQYERLEDTPHPMRLYTQALPSDTRINLYREDTKHFYLIYPDAYKLTGVSLRDLREMEVGDYEELKEIIKEHYELKKKYPDPMELLLKEFREYKHIVTGVPLNDDRHRD